MNRNPSPVEPDVMARWPSLLIMFLGLWLVVAPYLLGYADVLQASLNSILVGLTLAIAGGSRAYFGAPIWLSLVNFLLGAWLLIAPFGLGFPAVGSAAWTQAIVGIIVMCLAVAAAVIPAPRPRHEFVSAEPATRPREETDRVDAVAIARRYETDEERRGKDLVHAIARDVFGNRNPGRMRDYLTADFIEHTPFAGEDKTADGLERGLRRFFIAFPDLIVTVDDVIAEGDKVVLRGTFKGTHTGDTMGPPTGRCMAVGGVDIMRLSGGKIAEHWAYYDRMDMMRQMGRLPEET